MAASLKYKDPSTGEWIKITSEYTPIVCAAASVVNISTLAGLQLIDGYQTKVDDYVLLTRQQALGENGVWLVKEGGWVQDRSKQPGVSGLSYIGNGVTYKRTHWMCLKANPPEHQPLLDVIQSRSLTLNDIMDVYTDHATPGRLLGFNGIVWEDRSPVVADPVNLAGYTEHVGDLKIDPTTGWLQVFTKNQVWQNAGSVSVKNINDINPSRQPGLEQGMLIFDRTSEYFYLYWPNPDAPATDYASLQRLTYKALIHCDDPSAPTGSPVPSDLLENIYNDPNTTRVQEFQNMVVINHDWNTQDFFIQISDVKTGENVICDIARSANVIQVSINAAYPNKISVIIMQLL